MDSWTNNPSIGPRPGASSGSPSAALANGMPGLGRQAVDTRHHRAALDSRNNPVSSPRHLWPMIRDIQLWAETVDQIRWSWTTSMQYTMKSSYEMLLWNSWAPPRVKLLMFLALHGKTGRWKEENAIWIAS